MNAADAILPAICALLCGYFAICAAEGGEVLP
jgi:hypothetical protein